MVGHHLARHAAPESPHRIGQYGRSEAVQHGVALLLPGAVQRPEPGRSKDLAEPVELGLILGRVTALDPLSLLEVPVQFSDGIEAQRTSQLVPHDGLEPRGRGGQMSGHAQADLPLRQRPE